MYFCLLYAPYSIFCFSQSIFNKTIFDTHVSCVQTTTESTTTVLNLSQLSHNCFNFTLNYLPLRTKRKKHIVISYACSSRSVGTLNKFVILSLFSPGVPREGRDPHLNALPLFIVGFFSRFQNY